MTAEDLRMTILERLRNDVESGNGEAIIEAIATAANLGLPMPAWLASPVAGAIASYQNFETRTLDEAFGLQRKKGERQDAVVSERRSAIYVIAEVLRRHARGEPIDAGIFEAAGATCNVGKTTAETWFYKHKNDRTDIYLVARQMAEVSRD